MSKYTLYKILTAILLTTPLIFGSIVMAKNYNPEKSKHSRNDDKPIMVSPQNSEFTIQLPTNPTTGYAWFLKKYDARLIDVLSQVYKGPKSEKIGASGTAVFTFRMNPDGFKAQHVTHIALVYARPWELSKGEVKDYTVMSHKCRQIDKNNGKDDVNKWVC